MKRHQQLGSQGRATPVRADDGQASLHLAPGPSADASAGRASGRVIHLGTHADRSGPWLRNAVAGLGVLAGAAAVVSFTAQYRMIFAARRLALVAGLEAAIPDASALVFASLGIALALHGRRAIRARALNVASVAVSVFMNAIAAAPGWRSLAIWAMPPVAYALASDTLIGVIRAWAIARQQGAERPAGRRAGHAADGAGRPGAVAAAPDARARLDAGRVPPVGDRGMPGRPGPPAHRRTAGPGDHRAAARCGGCPARAPQRHQDGVVPRPGG